MNLGGIVNLGLEVLAGLWFTKCVLQAYKTLVKGRDCSIGRKVTIMVYYTIYGVCPVFGGGFLSITEEGKRLWSHIRQHFSKEEVDNLFKEDWRPFSVSAMKHTIEVGSGIPESVEPYAEKKTYQVFVG